MKKLERAVNFDGGDLAIEVKPTGERVADELRAARTLIEREGWVRGELHSYRGWCVVGALRRVGAGWDTYERLLWAAPPWAFGALCVPPEEVVHRAQTACMRVNDHVMTTKEEVLAWLDRAIGGWRLRSRFCFPE